jgi:pimeloyl-ACP methyl ester carboxylesterase
METAISSKDHEFCPLDGLCTGAFAHLSAAGASETAVVFVHGLAGDPTDTWSHFHSLIDSEAEGFPQWKSSDAFFFAYNAYSNSIDTSIDELLTFADAIFPIPSASLTKIQPNPFRLPHQYRRLILVGHSEGAVVIRACIAELGSRWKKSGARSPILDSRVSLFAPAHMGFVPSRWLGAVAVMTGIKTILELAISFSPAAAEMKDKTLLLQLKEITEKLYDAHPDVPAFTAHVLFGSEENVVVRSRYYQDCRHVPEKGKNHKTVCKPDRKYLRPMAFVMGDCPR